MCRHGGSLCTIKWHAPRVLQEPLTTWRNYISFMGVEDVEGFDVGKKRE